VLLSCSEPQIPEKWGENLYLYGEEGVLSRFLIVDSPKREKNGKTTYWILTKYLEDNKIVEGKTFAIRDKIEVDCSINPYRFRTIYRIWYKTLDAIDVKESYEYINDWQSPPERTNYNWELGIICEVVSKFEELEKNGT